MEVAVNERNGSRVAVITSDKTVINDVQDALDLIATISYMHNCNKYVLYKETLCEEFFDLSTRIAGEVLQKYVNYSAKLAIVGDFSVYASKSLRDFIYESNRGNHIFFLPTLDDALNRLHAV